MRALLSGVDTDIDTDDEHDDGARLKKSRFSSLEHRPRAAMPKHWK